MQEVLEFILDDRHVLIALIAVAVLTPLCGLLHGWWRARQQGRLGLRLLRGLAAGLLGPVILGMWFVYNSLVNRLGLDSVRNLLVNLGLFVGVGLLLGLGYRLLPDPDAAHAPPTAEPNAPGKGTETAQDG
jgi:hypothetical protein